MRRLAALALLLLALACSRGGQTLGQTQVGFLLGSMEKERYHKDRAAFARRVQELGGRVVFESAGGESAQEMKLGAEILARRVAVLVVQPVDAEAGRFLAREGRAAGIKTVAYDRLPAGAEFDWYVTHDSEAVGRSQAEYAVTALGGRGRVAILRGPGENPVAESITAGARQVLEKHPDIDLVAVVAHPRWVPAESRKSTASLLEAHPDLSAILCNNSALARGAVEVLQERGRAGKVYVAGADADLTNCQWIVQGLQGMDVLKEIEPLATAAADVAMALARGENPEATPSATRPGTRITRVGGVPALVLPVSPFDRSNLEQVVVASGFHPREALFPGQAHPPGEDSPAP